MPAPRKTVASVSDFKQKFGIQRVPTLELPSGLVVSVRTAGMRAFIQKGLVPNSLMKTITDAIEKGKNLDSDEAMKAVVLGEDGQIDQKKLQEMSELFDAVTCEVMVEPEVHPVPTPADLKKHNARTGQKLKTPDDLRSEDKLYVDEMDTIDKTFIFDWAVSGVSDLETFRSKLASGVDALANGSSVRKPAKRAPRTRT